MVDVGSFNRIGFVVVPIRVLQVQVRIGSVATGHHVCKMCPDALMGILGILIFDKRAFAVQVFIFGAV